MSHFYCDSRVFFFSELPKYKALSYTWGKVICESQVGDDDSNEDGTYHRVLVNKKSFELNENLFDAMVQFRTEDVGWIWIDAISLDRTNLDERSSQVLFMGEIYSQAEVIFIWLGSDAQDVETLLWAQDVLWRKCEEGIGELCEVNVQLLQALDMDLKGWLDAWTSVENFFRRRRWYRRAWVFQEAVLARQLEIRNGPTYLDWPRLSLIVRNGLHSGFGIPSVLHCVMISAYPQEIQEGKGRIWQDETGPIRTSLHYWYYTLLGLVSSLRSFQASCEHDKVFAALGLTLHHAPVHTPEFVVPEYAAPWEDAFVGFAKMLLRQIPCLIALSWVEATITPLHCQQGVRTIASLGFLLWLPLLSRITHSLNHSQLLVIRGQTK